MYYIDEGQIRVVFGCGDGLDKKRAKRTRRRRCRRRRCPECGGPPDERVEAGMKCGRCAYAGEKEARWDV